MKCAALLLFLPLLPAADDVGSIVQKVAETQRKLPWFWSPIMEGAGDLPYTYRMDETRQAHGRKTLIQMERIPLEGGSYYRCLKQDGKSPCPAELAGALEMDRKKAENFTEEEKAKAKAARDNWHKLRTAFWDEFPKALRFQQAGATEIRFTSTGSSNVELLAAMKGSLRFDPATFEITAMEYETLADVELASSKLYKGSRFSMKLEQAADRHYLPAQLDLMRKLPQGTKENLSMQYSEYKRFTSDSSIQFVDR